MYYLFYQNRPLKDSIASVLIISIIFIGGAYVFFQPKPVQAIITNEASSVPTTIQTILDKIKLAWEKVAEAYHAAASWISAKFDLWEKADTILHRIAVAALDILLRMVLAMITNEIIKWIQGGGEPRFISDWKGFLKDVVDKAGGKFIDEYLGMGWLCEEFDINIKIALLEVPKFEDRVKCTISDIVDNIEDFASNFSNGGWAAWIELTEPQNNFYGGYLIARDEKLRREAAAKEAAEQEAMAGQGFWSPRACVQGRIPETGGTCSSKESCDKLSEAEDEGVTFICDKEVAVTPGSVLSDITSKALTQEIDVLTAQIGDLTDSFGPYLKPYILAIANALVNRALKEGLAFVKGLGPDADNPNTPLPPGTTAPNIDTTPGGVISDQGQASSLLEQQELLKENLQTELLKEQQANLIVLQDIQGIQNNILNTLVNILKDNCNMPYFASSQEISVTISGNVTERTYQITAAGVGAVTIKKVIIQEGGGNETITYENQQNSPQVNAEITSAENAISETNIWIGQTAEAISATNGYDQAAQNYLDLFQSTLQPATQEEQDALDLKEFLMNTAENLVLEKGGIAIKVASTTVTTIEQLNTDTQMKNVEVIQTASNLIFARGIDPYFAEPGTLYAKKNDALGLYTAAQSAYSSCSGGNH